VDYAQEWGIETIWDRVQHLGGSIRTQLQEIDGITVRDLGKTRGGIVSFTHERVSPDHIYNGMTAQRINVKVSPARQSRLDMDARGLASVVRASLHYYNSEIEIARFVETLQLLVR
jgi:selenocysteine lyase/cysteine desulfurase